MTTTWWTMSADHGTAGKVDTANMAATHVDGDALARRCHDLHTTPVPFIPGSWRVLSNG